MSKRVYKTVFGIETGDLMLPSYTAGAYEVIGITRPLYVWGDFHSLAIHTLPVFTMVGGLPPSSTDYDSEQGVTKGWINDVRCEDGRYFSRNDEIVIEKRRPPYEQVIDMFESYLQPGDPYAWQAGVDYAAGDGRIFNCRRCGLDFNGERKARSHSPLCPRCEWVSRPIYIFDYGQTQTHYSAAARWMRIPETYKKKGS
jgi:hypothetical protein